jgi:hypothetical protein
MHGADQILNVEKIGTIVLERNLEILKREYGFRGEREKKGEKENEREEKG